MTMFPFITLLHMATFVTNWNMITITLKTKTTNAIYIN